MWQDFEHLHQRFAATHAALANEADDRFRERFARARRQNSLAFGAECVVRGAVSVFVFSIDDVFVAKRLGELLSKGLASAGSRRHAGRQ